MKEKYKNPDIFHFIYYVWHIYVVHIYLHTSATEHLLFKFKLFRDNYLGKHSRRSYRRHVRLCLLAPIIEIQRQGMFVAMENQYCIVAHDSEHFSQIPLEGFHMPEKSFDEVS